MDISFLSDEIRHAAVFAAGGEEVMWPREYVERAINELANHGIVVLGLDLRSDGTGETPEGVATEIPWSAYDGGDVQGARNHALRSLARPNLSEFQAYRWVLVTW